MCSIFYGVVLVKENFIDNFKVEDNQDFDRKDWLVFIYFVMGFINFINEDVIINSKDNEMVLKIHNEVFYFNMELYMFQGVGQLLS